MNPRIGFLGGRSPEQVQALLDQGLTQRALAERVGVTHQAVSRFVRRHGLLSGGMQAFRYRQAAQVTQRRRQVRQRLKEGLTTAEVAAQLSVSSATINSDCRVVGVAHAFSGREHRRLRGLDRAQVQARLMTVSKAQLARELGVSSSAVYSYCKASGLATCSPGAAHPALPS